MNIKTSKGSSVYTPLSLKLYDWWVLRISNRFAWRCPTDEYLLPHFLHHIGNNHLDIGVGTGYYPAHAQGSISLMDLNVASLHAASARLGEARVRRKIHHDVYEPFPALLHDQFDSISLFFLLHCLPGHIQEKGPVIANAARALTPHGTLFGATILGDGVIHNAFGQKLMAIYNRKGIFCNLEDSEQGLREILSAHFDNVEINVEGTVALFSASGKVLPDHTASPENTL